VNDWIRIWDPGLAVPDPGSITIANQQQQRTTMMTALTEAIGSGHRSNQREQQQHNSSIGTRGGTYAKERFEAVPRKVSFNQKTKDAMTMMVMATAQEAICLVPQSDSSKDTNITRTVQVAVCLVPQSDSSKGTMSSVTLDINKAAKQISNRRRHPLAQ
jgi:hypothetical protein